MFTLLSKKRNEEGVALVIAIIIIIVVAGIMSTVTIASVSSSQKSIQSREWIYHGQAVESAVQNALTLANSPYGTCADPNDPNNPNCIAYYGEIDGENHRWKKGKEGSLNWQWRVEGVTLPDETIAYDIYAIAYNPAKGINNNPRALKVRLQQQGVAEGYEITNKGNINYMLAPSNLFDWGIFATDSIELRPGSTVNSLEGSNLEPGAIATNGIVNFPQGQTEPMNIGSVHLLNSAQNSATDRCRVNQSSVPSELCQTSVVSEEAGVSLEGIYEKVMSTCMTTGAKNNGNWIASENLSGGDTATLRGGCYDSILIDANTVVAQENGNTPTISSPGEVFLRPGGSYIQRKGTSLRADSTDANNPALVRFYSAGEQFSFGNSGQATFGTADNVNFVGLVAGNNLKCTSYVPTGGVGFVQAKPLNITGGFACKTVLFGDKTSITRDAEASAQLKPNPSGAYVIWHTTTYQTTDASTVLGT